MTTFGCPECGRNWQEGPTRDYTENYLCRKCTEALAREAGEALESYSNRRECPECGKGSRHMDWCSVGTILTKLRNAGILKGGE